jgi:hypothetical protein
LHEHIHTGFSEAMEKTTLLVIGLHYLKLR